MGDGTVKYPGYLTDGKVKVKGMRNKRRTKVRRKKEALDREKQTRQRKREELEDAYSAEWEDRA